MDKKDVKVGMKVVVECDEACLKAHEFNGKIAEVRYVPEEGYVRGVMAGYEGHEFPLLFKNMRRADRKIVITTDGKETLARLYENGKVIRKTTAVCSENDDFDFGTGAKVAFDRLIADAEPEAPKGEWLNGRFVCVEPIDGLFQFSSMEIGKVYNVTDGVLEGYEYLSKFDGLVTNNLTGTHGLDCTGYRFIRIKED